jgi:hypothetical protein
MRFLSAGSVVPAVAMHSSSLALPNLSAAKPAMSLVARTMTPWRIMLKVIELSTTERWPREFE